MGKHFKRNFTNFPLKFVNFRPIFHFSLKIFIENQWKLRSEFFVKTSHYAVFPLPEIK